MTTFYHAIQLPMFPDKYCTSCNQPFPATEEYFYLRNKYDLGNSCKECHKKKTKDKTNHTFITLTCETCNKEFQRELTLYKREIKKRKNGHIYCSRSCGGKVHSKYLPLTTIGEEYLQGATLEELAEKYHVTFAAIRYHLHKTGIATRTWGDECHLKPMFVSQLEKRVAEELTKRGITFTPQFKIHGSNGKVLTGVDFMLTDGRAIEVNGTYWHADPRKYPDGPKNDTQKKKLNSDKRKQQILTEQNIPLIVLWEMDLTADFTGTLNRLL